MKKAAHVPGPEKFACQNEAVVCSLLAGDSTLAAHLGKVLVTYVTWPQVARVPLRKPRESCCTSFLVPPILAARIFPSSGQREKSVSLPYQNFHIFPFIKRRWGDLVHRVFFILVSFLLLSIQNSFSATFTDEVGRKVELPAPPQRIVSVAPSVTEVLFALGLGDRLAGVSSYCQFPPEALKKEKIGGYINPSLEKIIALRPDLVIGIAEGDLKTFVEKLARLKVPVYIIHPKNVSEVITSIQNIGEVTDSAQAAQRVTQAMKERIQAIQTKVQGRPRSRVLHVLNFDPLLSAGQESFVDDLIRLAGGRNIAETAQGKYPRFSLEEVLAEDPEVIILASMRSDDPLTQQRRWWERWKSISAVRHGRIYVFNSDLIHRPSPRIVDGLEEMAKAIHPEAFK